MLRSKFQLFGTFALVIAILGVEASAKGHHNKVVVQVGTSETERTSKIRVSFVEMVEDSRCPKDVECIWAGNAKIKIEVSKNGKSKVIELNSTIKNKDNTFDGYEFKLEKLTPEPASNIRINRNGYVATVTLVKTAKSSKKDSKGIAGSTKG